MEKLIYNPFSLVIAIFLVIISVISLQKNTQELNQSSVILAQTQNNIEKLDAEINQLKTEIEIAQTPFKTEQIIRNELLMKRPGEYILIVKTPPPTPAPTQKNTQLSTFAQWWQLLSN